MTFECKETTVVVRCEWMIGSLSSVGPAVTRAIGAVRYKLQNRFIIGNLLNQQNSICVGMSNQSLGLPKSILNKLMSSWHKMKSSSIKVKENKRAHSLTTSRSNKIENLQRFLRFQFFFKGHFKLVLVISKKASRVNCELL